MVSPFITALTFIVVYKHLTRFNVRPVVSASIVALFPFIAMLVHRAVITSSEQSLVKSHDVYILLLQFVAALIVFYKLHYDDAHMTWIIWGALGLIVVSIVIPVFVILAMYSL